MQAAAKLYGLPTIGCLSHHLQVWPLAQHLPERSSKEGVIVGYYEPRRPGLPFLGIIHLSNPSYMVRAMQRKNHRTRGGNKALKRVLYQSTFASLRSAPESRPSTIASELRARGTPGS